VLMGSLAFFAESALGIFELWLGVHAIFSGYLVPLEALPHWVRGAANVLPFRFMLGFPVETLVGLLGRHDAMMALAAQWGYVALFGLAARWVWRVGLRTFSAYGG
jgi:ABC-2 type transport system permease protein